MPQKKTYKMLVTKVTKHEGDYVFPGDLITAPNLTLVKMGKAVQFNADTMKNKPKELKAAYEAKREKLGALPSDIAEAEAGGKE